VNLDYYKILGVNQNASFDEIKLAYKKLAIKYHPDKNSGELLSEEIFKQVKEAYETLSDSEKKKKYDAKIQSSSNTQNPVFKKNAARNQRSYQPQYDTKHHWKYTLAAVGFVAFIAIITLTAYPHINKWASNDKLKKAKKSLATENWQQVLIHTGTAIELWDENGMAYLLRAQVKSSVYHQYESALSDFNAAFYLLPPDSIYAEHYYMRAKAHHELGHFKNACSDLKTAAAKGYEQAEIDHKILCKDD
jgi:curved DNA-binding protein CbpA